MRLTVNIQSCDDIIVCVHDIVADDEVDFKQRLVNKTSEGSVSQGSPEPVTGIQSHMAAISNDHLNETVHFITEGDDSKEEMTALSLHSDSEVGHDGDSLAIPAAVSSTDTVERTNNNLDGLESGGDLPREERRIRRVWRAICSGTRRVKRFLLPCLLPRTTED